MTDWVEMRSADMYCRWTAGAALCLFTFSYHCIVGKKNLTVYMAVMSAVYIKLERICNSSNENTNASDGLANALHGIFQAIIALYNDGVTVR